MSAFFIAVFICFACYKNVIQIKLLLLQGVKKNNFKFQLEFHTYYDHQIRSKGLLLCNIAMTNIMLESHFYLNKQFVI